MVSSFFGRPGYMYCIQGYSKHTVTIPLSSPAPPLFLFLPCVRAEQQSALSADCSVWVLRLWMLAVAMCHVLRILSLFWKHAVCVCRIYAVWWVSVCFKIYIEDWQMQWRRSKTSACSSADPFNISYIIHIKFCKRCISFCMNCDWHKYVIAVLSLCLLIILEHWYESRMEGLCVGASIWLLRGM